MDFSSAQIQRVAKLAKIKLTDNEAATFSEQFTSIGKIIDKLKLVDTSNVTPINNPSQAATLMRKDVVSDGDYVEDVLSNAPKSDFNCFVVPKVIE
jgi:aspartyl-tRNA(Asn)/glutamyl-tRNA(Gln) amidotransferase subunit C